jgi:PAS domain S-box-containing protein
MEAFWREIVEKTHLGVWILDPHDRTLFANERMAALLGLTPAEMLERTPLEIIGPHQSTLLLTRLKENHSGLTDFCLRRRDGKYLYLLFVTNPLQTTDGPARNTQIMVVDISERKLVEELLWRQAHIVDQIHDAVISADLGGCITSWNQSAERLLGLSAVEVLGKPLSVLDSPDQSKIVMDKVINALNQTGLYELEMRFRHKSGNPFFAHLSFSPLKGREGGIIGIIAAIRDITERKTLENELIRTSKLESISVLASGIAHDFNNMLTAILGNIAMASLNAESTLFVQERLAEAEKACIRAQNLTRQLLAFSTREKPQKKLVAIGDLLKTSASLVLRSSNVRRHVDIPIDLWWIEADEEQINQILHHLLINADQAMPQGGAITIQAENVQISEKGKAPLKPGKYVRVSIKDEGVGIPTEQLGKVFDPLFTTKRRGSGMGLATVYTIIKNHDGNISVESVPQGGARFIIYLPASRKKGPIPRPKTLKLSFGRGKVLLMDDEKMVLEVSSAMLKRLGYDVTVAQDGAEAIKCFRQATLAGEPFDAVILDLTVPGGLGAKETIRDLQQINPKAKVIVSSGFSDDPLKTDYQDFGFSGFMPKPYNLTQLSAAMHKILK